MRKSISFAVLAGLTLLLAVTPANLLAQPERQDGSQIARLQWHGPPGVLPGTYADYLAENPLRPASFTQAIESADKSPSDLAILVDATLYPQIDSAITAYIADIDAEGVKAEVHTVSGGTPQEIKDWVIARYGEGCEGFLFIGNITAAWAEVSGSQFPSDLFYMDLDGGWYDTNSDGIYDLHTVGTGDQAPEVYIGRMYASSLPYDSEANLVNNYFAKAHEYREYTLAEPWHSMEYVEEDWWDMAVNMDLVYDDSVTRHDYGFHTTAADYLNQMDLGHHFVTVCVHSWTEGHHFGTRPTESAAYAHTYVFSPSTRSARLLVGADDGARVWVNGVLALHNEGYGHWMADNWVADVTLDSGWNQLLCKGSQAGGTFKISARLADASYQSFDDLKYQCNDPSAYPEEAPFVRGWLLNGFHQDVDGNFWGFLTTNYLGVSESGLNPIAGQVDGGQMWTESSSGCPYVDMCAHDSSDYGVCYAFVTVNSPTTQPCQLWLGYDDGARAWLNGSQILNDNTYGGFVADETKVSVILNAGDNRLLVKISQWMGTHGFSARFCHSDGSAVQGLTYGPEPDPIAHIGTWLVNGPYANPNPSTRLTEDYLGGETTVLPVEGMPAPVGEWELSLGKGLPFDFGSFYDRGGDYVYSSTVQDRDPPVLFFNLFSCGPGRFTDNNYLAGSYIFNTSTALITVASAKSGSMLNFQDFYGPLSEPTKTVGQAFLEWFQTQAPFQLWEQEWYYGMVLNGDPTLQMMFCVDNDGDGYGDPTYSFSTCQPDNCPDTPNPDQSDTNGDGVGDACCCVERGDIDGNGSGPDIADLVYLVAYMFASGPAPACMEACDVDGSGADPDIADVVYLVAYMFNGGFPPVDCQ